MSNLSDTKKNPNSALSHRAETAPCAPAKIDRWSFIQNDLTKAMDTWQELDKKEFSASPEEEQLAKIKTIISQLKAKLEQF